MAVIPHTVARSAHLAKLPGFIPGTPTQGTYLRSGMARTGLPYLERVAMTPGQELSAAEQASYLRQAETASTYTRVAGEEFAYLERATVPHIIVGLKSRIPRIIAELPGRLEVPMELVARRIRVGAQLNLVQNGSFISGELFRSLREYPSMEGEVAWTVGSDMPYAGFVEYGTGRSEAKPYLAPAAEDMVGELEPIFAGALVDL